MIEGVGSDHPEPFFAPRFSQQPRVMSFKFDEGYSEDTRSQSENDVAMRGGTMLGDVAEHDQQVPLPHWVMGLDEAARSGE